MIPAQSVRSIIFWTLPSVGHRSPYTPNPCHRCTGCQTSSLVTSQSKTIGDRLYIYSDLVIGGLLSTDLSHTRNWTPHLHIIAVCCLFHTRGVVPSHSFTLSSHTDPSHDLLHTLCAESVTLSHWSHGYMWAGKSLFPFQTWCTTEAEFWSFKIN